MIKIFILLCSFHCILSVHATPKFKESQSRITADDECSNYHIADAEVTDFTTIDDYRGQQLHRRWNLKSGPITLDQDTNDATKLLWTKPEIMVTLQVYADKAVDQKWQFLGATITINNAADRSVNQKWNLGQKWFHYERKADQSVKAEGNADEDDLVMYKQGIDCWCKANSRFFPTDYCAIYNKY